MDEDCEVPLILGHLFLTSSRALVDVENGELVLRLNDEKVVFNMFKSANERPTLKYCSAVYLVDVMHGFGEFLQVQLSAGISPQCRDTAVTTTNSGVAAQTWFIDDVGRDGDVLSAVSSREGSGGYTCQHALTARNNVVVDIQACGWDVVAQAATLAHRVAERISRTL